MWDHDDNRDFDREDYGTPLDPLNTALWLAVIVGGVLVWVGVVWYFWPT
jgi:hypothetical protein